MSNKVKVTFDIIRAKCGWRGKDLLLIARPDDSWNNPEFLSDPYYPYSRMIAFRTYLSQLWGEEDFQQFLTAIDFIQRPGVSYKRSCLLSVEGDFIIREEPEDTIEKIPGAGIDADDGRGRLYGMTIINNHVYAYGDARQIYKRDDNGTWLLLDKNFFQPVSQTSMQSMATIFDLQGLSEDAIYVVDTAGCIYFWDGSSMQLVHQVSGVMLVSIVIEDENTVWIGGSDATLLKGNARQGFSQVLNIDGSHNFVSMTRFKDKLYLASHGGGWDVGAYVYENNQLTKLQTDLIPETEYDAHTVTSTDDDLWVVGIKDILHYDGENWERIDLPGNPPIR